MLQNDDLLYPELSYKIVGCAFDVFREIGGDHREKIYQRAMSSALRRAGLKFVEQKKQTVHYHGENVGNGFSDLLVEDKIIVELKRGKNYFEKELEQLLDYLKTSKLQLGIIIRFTPNGARFKRVVNIAG